MAASNNGDAPVVSLRDIKKIYQMGDVEVFALSDKRFVIDATRFAHLAESEWPQAMAQSFKSDPGLKGVAAYAIRHGGTVVLVNAGRGSRQGDDLGQVAEHLKAVGISPDKVSAVFLTSLHADQVGGLLGQDEQRQFKNAQLYASQEAMVFDGFVGVAGATGIEATVAGHQGADGVAIDLDRGERQSTHGEAWPLAARPRGRA